MKTLLIPFTASQVNMSPTPYVWGTVSMMGLTGFGHAAIRLISESIGHCLVDLGAALIVSEHHFSKGYLKPTWSKVVTRERTEGGAPLSEGRIGAVTGFVILRFDCGDDAAIAFERKLPQLRFDLAKLRFIGGRFFPDTQNTALFLDDPFGLKALQGLPYDARVYVDHTRLIERYAAAHQVDRLEALIELSRLHLKSELKPGVEEQAQIGLRHSGSEGVDAGWMDETDEATIAKELDNLEEPGDDFDYDLLDSEQWSDASADDLLAAQGWIDQYYGRLIPIDIGYLLLEQPKPRPHRFATSPHYPHAFAEPVLGLARLQSVASCRKQKAPIFWRVQPNLPSLIATGIEHDC